MKKFIIALFALILLFLGGVLLCGRQYMVQVAKAETTTQSKEFAKDILESISPLEKVKPATIITGKLQGTVGFTYDDSTQTLVLESGQLRAAQVGTQWTVNGITPSRVKHVELQGVIEAVGNGLQNLFWNFTNLEDIKGLEKLDISQATTLYAMFQGCSSLTSIDLSNFNASNVISLMAMFSGCSSLKNIDFSSLTGEKVINASSMFYGCTSLESVDFSNFKPLAMIDNNQIFNADINLKRLKLNSKFRFVTKDSIELYFDSTYMSSTRCWVRWNESNDTPDLNYCYSANPSTNSFMTLFNSYPTELNEIETWVFDNYPKVYGQVFAHLEDNDETLVLDQGTMTSSKLSDGTGDINLKKIKKMIIPKGITIKSGVDISGADNVVYPGMFNEVSSTLEEIIGLENLDLSNVNSLARWFSGCDALKRLDLSGIDMTSFPRPDGMLKNCISLREIKLGEKTILANTQLPLLDLDKSEFDNSWQEVGRGTFDKPKGYKFKDSTELMTNYDGSHPGTYVPGRVLYIWGKVPFSFDETTGTLSLSSGELSNSVDLADFLDYYTLDDIKHIVITGPLDVKTSSLSKLFQSFVALEDIAGLSFIPVQNVTNMSSLFSGCQSLTNLDLSSFNTSSVTDMTSLFNGCQSLTTLDLSNFDTSALTTNDSIFTGLKALNNLKLGEKTKFVDSTALPTINRTGTYTGKWANVGSGTVDNPEGQYKFKSPDISTIYQGGAMADTYVWEKTPMISITLPKAMVYATTDSGEVKSDDYQIVDNTKKGEWEVEMSFNTKSDFLINQGEVELIPESHNPTPNSEEIKLYFGNGQDKTNVLGNTYSGQGQDFVTALDSGINKFQFSGQYFGNKRSMMDAILTLNFKLNYLD